MFELKFRHIDKLQLKDIEDNTFGEVIETIYGWDDKLIILWDTIEIPVFVKWDVSDSGDRHNSRH